MAAYIPALGDLESELVMSPTRLRLGPMTRLVKATFPSEALAVGSGIIIPPPLRSVEIEVVV